MVVVIVLFLLISLFILLIGVVWYKSIETSNDHQITTIQFHDGINENKLMINDLTIQNEEQDEDDVSVSQKIVNMENTIEHNTESIENLKGYVDDKIKELKNALLEKKQETFFQNELSSDI